MKLSTVAAAVTALLAIDAKPTEAQIMAACFAADKKGKDEGGLGNVEIQNKAKDEKEAAEDAAEEYFGHGKDEWEKMPAKDKAAARDKARDEKDDPENTNGKDEEIDGMDDVQPKESVTGAGSPAGNKGKEPAKDKKGMDSAIKAAIAEERALNAARRDVEPVIGVVTYDSASEVYKAGLVKLGVAVDGIHSSAYPALFKMACDKANARSTMASDAATVKTMAAAIPGYSRLK